jgi:UDP-glucose 4-epimerase
VKKILITGANGLIGNELIEKLSKDNELYAISRKKIQNKENVEYIQMDLSSGLDENKLPKEIDVIYHLAQSENFRKFPEKAQDVFRVNTLSTLNLLDYASRASCEQFIYASSGGVYGNSEDGFKEDELLVSKENLGFYLGTKFCSEILVENYKSIFDVVIARFFFVYGPRQNKSMLIPRLINNVQNNLPITLFGKEGIVINPIFFKDACDALISVQGTNGICKLNIGGNEQLSLKSIVEIIGKVVDVCPDFKYVDAESNNLIGNIDKLKENYYSPEISFLEGIKKMVDEG